MAPKKRDKADAEPAAKRPRTRTRQAVEGAAGQTVASQDVVVALAGALDKSAAAMPPIRKVVLEGEQVASVYDAVVALAGCAAKNAVVVFKRLAERYPEVTTTCSNFKFAGQGQRETPVANAKTLVQIILLLPGEVAAKVRTQASRVFVDFLGGNAALVEEILQNRQMQELLQRENPEHWARFFGEHVEAASSSGVQQDLAQKTCEAVVQAAVPAIARMVDACSKQFQEALAVQAAAQQEALGQMQAAARQLAGARAVVNINTSSRGGLDSLDHANLDPPVDEEGAERIRRSAAPLTKFLRDRWQSEWKRAGLRHTSVSLQFAILMQAGVDTSAPPAAIN